MRAVVFLFVLCFAAPVFADISSTRPMPRPAGLSEASAPLAVPPQAAAPQIVASAASPARSIRPPRRPEGAEVAARNPGKGLLGRLFGPAKTVERKPDTKAAPRSVAGSVCEDPAIRGTEIPDIKGAQKGCGVTNPVRVTSVDGVTLSTPATLDCDTARALRRWVSEKAKPAFGIAGITGLRVAAHYACRGRNNKKGARVSEHGRGKAIDISGFILSNGAEITVLQNYKSAKGKPIRAAHQGACGIFGTTLGPGSDGYHETHIHFDTARHRGGPYCK